MNDICICMLCMYVCIFGRGLPQSSSSLASEQSTLPLHRSFAAMQSPVLQLAMSDEFIVDDDRDDNDDCDVVVDDDRVCVEFVVVVVVVCLV